MSAVTNHSGPGVARAALLALSSLAIMTAIVVVALTLVALGVAAVVLPLLDLHGLPSTGNWSNL